MTGPTSAMDHDLDAVVVGTNIRGLVTAYVLASLGYRLVVLEKGARVGGADGSFTTAGGDRFELGMHVLDYMRSEVATRLFTHVVDGQVHRTTLERAIVLRGHVMPYAPKPGDMPEELREMLPSDDLVDDLGDEPPTRNNLARYYGKGFTDLIFDEVLPSFPSENRHRQFGVDEARLMPNIYPWFFPRAKRKPKSGDGSRQFHDRLRSGIPQEILYPRQGGFGGFAQGFVNKLTDLGVDVITGASDLEVRLSPGTHTVERVTAAGRTFEARHYFWATSWPALCQLLSIPCQEVATDRVMLGSFRFDRPLTTRYQELLVGDPTLSLNRVYLPARFRESDEPLLQVEFAVPRAEAPPTDGDHWRGVWVDNLKRIGLLDEHRIEEFDFKSVLLHFNAFGMEGEALRDADPNLVRSDSNLFPVVPSMANLNLNNHVPRTVAEVTARICRDRG